MPAAQQELSPPGMYKDMSHIPLGLLRPVLAKGLIAQIEAVIYDERMHWRLRGEKVEYRAHCGWLYPIGEGFITLFADHDGLDAREVQSDFLLLVQHFTGHGFEVSASFYTKDGLMDITARDEASWPSDDVLRDVIGISIEIRPPRGFTGRLPLCR